MLLSYTVWAVSDSPGFPLSGRDFIKHNLRVAIDIGDNGSTDEIVTFQGDMTIDRRDPYTNRDGRKQVDFIVRDWHAMADSNSLGMKIFYILSPDVSQPTSTITAQQSDADYPAYFRFNVIFDAFVGDPNSPPVVVRHHGRPEGGGFGHVPPNKFSPVITQFESTQIVVNHPTLGPVRFTPVDCHDQESSTAEAIPSVSFTGFVILAILLASTVLVFIYRRQRAMPTAS